MKRSVFNTLKGNIMVTRKIKPTVVITPVVATAAAAPTYREQMHAMLDQALDSSGEPVGWKRTLTAWVVGLSSAFGVGYLVGLAIAYMVVGASVLGAGTFLCTVIYILGVLVAMFLGNKVAVFTYMSIMDKTIDTACSGAYNKVRGWFGGSAIETVAA